MIGLESHISVKICASTRFRKLMGMHIRHVSETLSCSKLEPFQYQGEVLVVVVLAVEPLEPEPPPFGLIQDAQPRSALHCSNHSYLKDAGESRDKLITMLFFIYR